ncbi:MAG: hypothetical protein SR1Q7_10430 [Quinella sp. 1Q7]|nr:hypothetical protein [Quinella sp. 1Q7]
MMGAKPPDKHIASRALRGAFFVAVDEIIIDAKIFGKKIFYVSANSI